MFLVSCIPKNEKTSEVQNSKDSNLIVLQTTVIDSSVIPSNEEKVFDNGDTSICTNSLYRATLIGLEEDNYKLSVRYKNGKTKRFNLNLPPRMADIRWCTSDYVAIGFSCMGPCFARTFVFLDGRPKETYGYSISAKSNHNIITYIKDEVFDTLRIRNLTNGKELETNISECSESLFPCSADSLIVKGNKLHVYYYGSDGKTLKKVIDIKKIL